MMAIFRPDNEDKSRPTFNLVHRVLGTFTLCLASKCYLNKYSLKNVYFICLKVVTLFLGTNIEDLGLGSNGWGVLIGWVAWLVIIPLILEIVESKLGDRSPSNLKELLLN